MVEEDSTSDGEPSSTPDHMHMLVYSEPMRRDVFQKWIKRHVFDDKLTPVEWSAFKGTGKSRGLLVAYNFGWFDQYMAKQHDVIGPDMTPELRAEITKCFPMEGSLKSKFVCHWYADLEKKYRSVHATEPITLFESQALISASMFKWRTINVVRDKPTLAKKAVLLQAYINRDVLLDYSHCAKRTDSQWATYKTKKRKRIDTFIASFDKVE